jgi:UDP-N-acetylmuramate dehydrogenase
MVDVFQQIEEIEGVAARKDELLSMHTTFGVGGACDLMVWVSTRPALKEVIQVGRSHSLPVMVLGNGSNVLVKDGGIGGIVVRLADEFTGVSVEDNHIRGGGGASLAEVVSRATASGIGGLEFLAGIPGTLGGAVLANAGSGDTWLSHRLVGLGLLTGDLREIEVGEGDIAFGYRTCGLQDDWVVTEVVLAGSACSIEEARRGVEEHLSRRKTSQPAGERTAGCVFKNPAGDVAGRMIDEIGMKGFKVGGAQVSSIHANWIVNTGGATAREILDLIEVIRERVKEQTGTELELEIKVIGRD